MSRRKSTLADFGDTLTDTLSDAWSTTAGLAHDLASSAADVAGDLTTAAGSGLSEGAGRVTTLYEHALERVHPRPRRRVSPWLLIAAAAVSFVAVGWWLRRRGQDDAGPAARPDLTPVADTGPAHRAAAGS